MHWRCAIHQAMTHLSSDDEAWALLSTARRLPRLREFWLKYMPVVLIGAILVFRDTIANETHFLILYVAILSTTFSLVNIELRDNRDKLRLQAIVYILEKHRKHLQ